VIIARQPDRRRATCPKPFPPKHFQTLSRLSVRFHPATLVFPCDSELLRSSRQNRNSQMLSSQLLPHSSKIRNSRNSRFFSSFQALCSKQGVYTLLSKIAAPSPKARFCHSTSAASPIRSCACAQFPSQRGGGMRHALCGTQSRDSSPIKKMMPRRRPYLTDARPSRYRGCSLFSRDALKRRPYTRKSVLREAGNNSDRQTRNDESHSGGQD